MKLKVLLRNQTLDHLHSCVACRCQIWAGRCNCRFLNLKEKHLCLLTFSPRRILAARHLRERLPSCRLQICSTAGRSSAPGDAGPGRSGDACRRLPNTRHLRRHDQEPPLGHDAAAGGRQSDADLCEVGRRRQSRSGADADRPAEAGRHRAAAAGNRGAEEGGLSIQPGGGRAPAQAL